MVDETEEMHPLSWKDIVQNDKDFKRHSKELEKEKLYKIEKEETVYSFEPSLEFFKCNKCEKLTPRTKFKIHLRNKKKCHARSEELRKQRKRRPVPTHIAIDTLKNKLKNGLKNKLKNGFKKNLVTTLVKRLTPNLAENSPTHENNDEEDMQNGERKKQDNAVYSEDSEDIQDSDLSSPSISPSALFSPVNDNGIIVCEEQDDEYSIENNSPKAEKPAKNMKHPIQCQTSSKHLRKRRKVERYFALFSPMNGMNGGTVINGDIIDKCSIEKCTPIARTLRELLSSQPPTSKGSEEDSLSSSESVDISDESVPDAFGESFTSLFSKDGKYVLEQIHPALETTPNIDPYWKAFEEKLKVALQKDVLKYNSIEADDSE